MNKPLSEMSPDEIGKYILVAAASSDVTDIHMQPGFDGYTVWYTVAGERHKAMTIPAFCKHRVAGSLKDFADVNSSSPKDARFVLEDYNHGRKWFFYLTAIPTEEGDEIWMKIRPIEAPPTPGTSASGG